MNQILSAAFAVSISLPIFAADSPAPASANPPVAPVSEPKPRPKAPPLPAPSHANVSYGAHERNVFDIWLAKSDQPTPLLVYIHGGGWINGDKKSLSAATLKKMLDNGISVAAVNYRYSTIAPLPAPVHDAARAIQFIRSKATEWNIKKDRVAAMGGSAGACTSMWLNYHDDIADPKSADPIARESTRLSAIYVSVGQTSIDPKVIVDWVGEKVLDHPMISRAVGAKNGAEALQKHAQYAELYREFSAFNHVDKSDPPALLTYDKAGPVPAPDPGAAIHHTAFGVKLKEKADAVGATVHLKVAGDPNTSKEEPHQFLIRELKK